MPRLKREPDCYPDDLFAAPGEVPPAPWWVAWVRSRREKELARHLREHQVSHYLPQQEKRTTYRGRTRRSYLPLFPGYLFFRGDRGDCLLARKSAATVRNLEVLDQGQLHRELVDLFELQQLGGLVVSHPYLGPGDSVQVTEGPFRGFRGVVVREHHRDKLVVSVTFLRRSVAVLLERDTVQPAR